MLAGPTSGCSQREPWAFLQVGTVAAGHAGRLVADEGAAEGLYSQGLLQDEGPTPGAGQVRVGGRAWGVGVAAGWGWCRLIPRTLGRPSLPPWPSVCLPVQPWHVCLVPAAGQPPCRARMRVLTRPIGRSAGPSGGQSPFPAPYRDSLSSGSARGLPALPSPSVFLPPFQMPPRALCGVWVEAACLSPTCPLRWLGPRSSQGDTAASAYPELPGAALLGRGRPGTILSLQLSQDKGLRSFFIARSGTGVTWAHCVLGCPSSCLPPGHGL